MAAAEPKGFKAFLTNAYCSTVPRDFAIKSGIESCQNCDNYRDLVASGKAKKEQDNNGYRVRCSARHLPTVDGDVNATTNLLPPIKIFITSSEQLIVEEPTEHSGAVSDSPAAPPPSNESLFLTPPFNQASLSTPSPRRRRSRRKRNKGYVESPASATFAPPFRGELLGTPAEDLMGETEDLMGELLGTPAAELEPGFGNQPAYVALKNELLRSEQKGTVLRQELQHLHELLILERQNAQQLLDNQAKSSVLDTSTKTNREHVGTIESSVHDLNSLMEGKERVRGGRFAELTGIAINAFLGLILGGKWVLTKCCILLECI
jgi:hypothetical protein